MKKLTFGLLFIVCLGCQDEPGVGARVGVGCHTGKLKSTGARVFIRCCESNEVSNNVAAGGLDKAVWDLYTEHQWEKCDDCK